MLLHKEKTSFLGFSFMIDKDMLSYSIYLYIFKYNLPYLNTSHVNVNLYPTPTFLIVNLILHVLQL